MTSQNNLHVMSFCGGIVVRTYFADVDECEAYSYLYLCENGQCVNTVGGFQCDCPSGFNQSKNYMCQGTAFS